MAESKTRRGLGLLLEFIVIVVGVLVALAADSWSQGRQDQERVRSYLVALQSDLAAARASIETELEQTLTDAEGAEAWLALISGTGPTGTNNVPSVGWRDMPTVPDGTFDALVATGDINLLGDSLRNAIVAGYAALAPEVATLERLYDLGAIQARDHLFTLARIRIEEGLTGEIPLDFGRKSPAVVATYQLYTGMLYNRRDALSTMLEAVTHMETQLSGPSGGD